MKKKDGNGVTFIDTVRDKNWGHFTCWAPSHRWQLCREVTESLVPMQSNLKSSDQLQTSVLYNIVFRFLLKANPTNSE